MTQTTGFENKSRDPLDTIKNTVSETAERAQEKLKGIGRSVEDTIDENREPAADKLQGVASSLHEKAASLRSRDRVADFADSAAHKVEATAQYVRDHDVQDMVADMENLIRRHPGQSLMAAAAVGFLLGRTFRNDA